MSKQWWEEDVIYYPAKDPCPKCGTLDAKFTRATGRKACCKCGAFLDLIVYEVELGVSAEGAAWAMEGGEVNDTIQIGPYACRVYFNMPYNIYELTTRGPYIHKRGRMMLRGVVSSELIEDMAYLDWRPILAQQFDQQSAAIWRTAPIMQRKIRRMVRHDNVCS